MTKELAKNQNILERLCKLVETQKPSQMFRTTSFIAVLMTRTALILSVAIVDAEAQLPGVEFTKKGKSINNSELAIVAADKDTRLASTVVPFDRPFFFKVPVLKPPVGAHMYILTAFIFIDGKIALGTSLASRRSGPSAEDVMIEVLNLKPEQAYTLYLTWTPGVPGPAARPVHQVYYLTTQTDSLEKRAGFRLAPQLGVTSAFFRMSSQNAPRASLMVGVYFHPRQMNRDIPTEAYKWFAPQRLSILMGISLNSMAVDYIRDDLFAKNNFMLGVGYQPLDAVRISGGMLGFGQLPTNRLLSGQRGLGVTTFAAITLDLKLKDILSGVITTLGFK